MYIISQVCLYSELTIIFYLSALYYNIGILVLRDAALIAINAYSVLPNEWQQMETNISFHLRQLL